MITLNLMGGLGNQMFQYAFVRALSEEFDDKDIRINPYFMSFINLVTAKKALKPSNSLVHFKLNENVEVMSKTTGIPKAFAAFSKYCWNSFFVTLTQEMYERRSKKGRYFQTTKDTFDFYTHSKTTKPKKSVTGYYTSEKYFADIGDILRKEFKVVSAPDKRNADMIEKIKACNAVCVHIRRGDYLLPQNTFLNVCTENYYKQGMKYIAEHTDDPVFFVFSNTHEELEWIKNNYRFDYPVEYVDLGNPDFEELRLMYNCKHFVMCNSTFSWWASYLSENKDKIVAAPAKWLNNNDKRFEEKVGDIIYRKDMIKIPIDMEG